MKGSKKALMTAQRLVDETELKKERTRVVPNEQKKAG
jgi:hypothetical protein